MKNLEERISEEEERKMYSKERTKLVISKEQDSDGQLQLLDDLDNLFVFDDKNKYYELLKDKMKDIKILNFKELENSVSWNPLTYPYYLYKNGDLDTAIELINKIGFTIMKETDENPDLFWIYASSDYFTSLTLHLFEKEKDIKNMNITRVLELSNAFEKGLLDEYYSKLDEKTLEYKLISTVINAPLNTKLGILSVFNQKMKLISMRPSLSEKLSGDDIRLDRIDFEKENQCVLVVLNPTLNRIATIFINQLNKVLEKKKPKQKINIILDSLDRIAKIEELEDLLENDNNLELNLIATTKNKENLINKYGDYTISLFEKMIDKE